MIKNELTKIKTHEDGAGAVTGNDGSSSSTPQHCLW